jgi:hypothetical protein
MENNVPMREYFIEYSEKYSQLTAFLTIEDIPYIVSDADIIYFKLQAYNDTAFADFLSRYFAFKGAWNIINEKYNPKNK